MNAITKYPIKYPSTTWKYPNALAPTVPGTLTKVTPLNEVPIIPKETSIQLLFRLPIKKESLLLLRLVYHATPSNKRKYAITNENKNVADMLMFLFKAN